MRDARSQWCSTGTGRSPPRSASSARRDLIVGLVVTRYVLELPPVAAMVVDDLVSAIAPTLQGHLIGRLQLDFDRAEAAVRRGSGDLLLARIVLI